MLYGISTLLKRNLQDVFGEGDTPEYLHVSIAVDGGSLPASIHPENESFICRKAIRSSDEQVLSQR